MEIIELISFHINHLSNTLDVIFRMDGDNEDEFREDKINFYEVEDFGYDFIIKMFENSNDENRDFNDNDDEYVIDENEVLNFLNDYYSLYPEKIPNIEL